MTYRFVVYNVYNSTHRITLLGNKLREKKIIKLKKPIWNSLSIKTMVLTFS